MGDQQGLRALCQQARETHWTPREVPTRDTGLFNAEIDRDRTIPGLRRQTSMVKQVAEGVT